MRVCYYRDCRTVNRVTKQRLPVWRNPRPVLAHIVHFNAQIQLAKVTDDGTAISPTYKLATKWDYASFVKSKAGADTGGSW